MPWTYVYDEDTENLKRKYISPDPQKALIQKRGGIRKYNEWKMIKYEARINEFDNEIHNLKMILSMNEIYEWNLEDYENSKNDNIEKKPYTNEDYINTYDSKNLKIDSETEKELIKFHGGKNKYIQYKFTEYELILDELVSVIKDLKAILIAIGIYEWNFEEYKEQHLNP
jgi:hypothetical protein